MCDIICYINYYVVRKYTMAEGRVEIAPFRTIADFLTDAQFTGPAISDSSRWYNRIKQNLLYYQTNYFVVMILVVAIYR